MEQHGLNREEKIAKLVKAMDDARAHIQRSLEQRIEALDVEDPAMRERVERRAAHDLEEARINYDHAMQALWKLDDEERNERLEALARSSERASWAAVSLTRSSARASWAAVVVAAASVLVSLVALLKH